MQAWKKYFQILLTRPIVFYTTCILAVCLVLNYPLFRKNSVDQTMNRLTPPINYYKEFVEPKDHFNEYKLRQCVYYHQKVIDLYNFERHGAYTMLGYCDALLGDNKKAAKAFQSSVDINPNNFWPYYDLGILSYRQGDYKKAVNYFQIALSKDPKLNVYVLFTSKIYADVRLSDSEHSKYNFLDGLREGRLAAYVFLLESLSKVGDFEKMFEIAMLGLKEKLGNEDILYFYAGKGAFHQKYYDKALELFQLSINSNAKNSDAYYYLALCMRLAGKEELAKQFFDTAKEIYQYNGSLREQQLNSKVRYF
jgi:uncharacterized protein HemY